MEAAPCQESAECENPLARLKRDEATIARWLKAYREGKQGRFGLHFLSRVSAHMGSEGRNY